MTVVWGNLHLDAGKLISGSSQALSDLVEEWGTSLVFRGVRQRRGSSNWRRVVDELKERNLWRDGDEKKIDKVGATAEGDIWVKWNCWSTVDRIFNLRPWRRSDPLIVLRGDSREPVARQQRAGSNWKARW